MADRWERQSGSQVAVNYEKAGWTLQIISNCVRGTWYLMALKGAVRTAVIANEVKQSSIVYGRSLQEKVQYFTVASFCNSAVRKIRKIATSPRSPQGHKVRFQVIATDSKNHAAIPNITVGLFQWPLRHLFFLISLRSQVRAKDQCRMAVVREMSKISAAWSMLNPEK